MALDPVLTSNPGSDRVDLREIIVIAGIKFHRKQKEKGMSERWRQVEPD